MNGRCCAKPGVAARRAGGARDPRSPRAGLRGPRLRANIMSVHPFLTPENPVHRPLSAAVLCLALTLAACAGSGAPGAGTAATSGTAPSPVRGSLNLITGAEIEAAGNDVVSAYELVLRLRPGMMRPRNQTAGNTSEGNAFGVIAFADDIRLGDLEQLRTIMRGTVREIRYISATDATTRWGTGHSNGVVQVITKR